MDALDRSFFSCTYLAWALHESMIAIGGRDYSHFCNERIPICHYNHTKLNDSQLIGMGSPLGIVGGTFMEAMELKEQNARIKKGTFTPKEDAYKQCNNTLTIIFKTSKFKK